MSKKLPPPPDVPDKIIITDTLDLHGFFPEQIPELINTFIDNAMELGLKQLHIIHGKGKSRLKFEVLQILKNRPEVKQFRDAPPDLGGWGSTVVLLKDSQHP